MTECVTLSEAEVSLSVKQAVIKPEKSKETYRTPSETLLRGIYRHTHTHTVLV